MVGSPCSACRFGFVCLCYGQAKRFVVGICDLMISDSPQMELGYDLLMNESELLEHGLVFLRHESWRTIQSQMSPRCSH